MRIVKPHARRNQRGAVAIVVAISMVALMAAAAIGVDIAKQVYERQQLQNALDAAAAAGAQQLPDNPTQAIKDAQTFASDNMVGANLGTIVPDVTLRCVVAYNSTTKSPDWTTVSSLCGITSRTWDPLTCNEVVCSVECTVVNKCNTIVVKYNKRVDYSFGPAINIDYGWTGSIVSAACRGLCGRAVPNPMNVVVMADRTYSMSNDAVAQMKTGIENMLATMTADQQYVAMGAIHKSTTVGSCLTGVATSSSSPYTSDSKFTLDKPTGSVKFKGTWVPVPFSNNYTKVSGQSVVLNTSSTLYKSVDCMTRVDNGLGTHPAAAMKGAARYLLGYDNGSTDLSSLPTRNPDLGTPKKVIIFETDGRPEELFQGNNPSTDRELSNTNDIGAGSYTAVKDRNNNITDYTFQGDGEAGCENLVTEADKAKAAGVDLIITIGYGNATKFTCAKSSKAGSDGLYNVSGATKMVDDYLAKAASKDSNGNASTADKSTCAAENADGDWYFCASTGTDLASIFLTAMGQISGHGRLMSLPGASSFKF